MLFRILICTALIILCISSMLIGATIEMRISELYISDWLSGMLFYRIFIGTTLYTAIVILFGANNKLIKISLITICSFIWIDTLYYITDNSHYLSLFIHPFQKALCYTIAGILTVCALIFIKNIQPELPKNKIYLLAIIPTIALSFIKVVYIEDWTNQPTNAKHINYETATQLTKSIDIKGQPKELLMPFFSTSCGYCRIAATKLAISMKNNTLPETCIVFPGSKEKAELFLKETKLTGIKYITVPSDSFVELAGRSLPSIFWITQDTSAHYLGGQFNNIVLSSISK